MSRSHVRRYLIPVATVVLLLLGGLVAPSPASAEDGPPAGRAVREAWQRAQEAGSYRFATEVVQTTFPALAVANVGRSPSEETIYLEGQVDLPARSMEMGLWQGNGGVADPGSGIELRIEGDRGYARQPGGAWQEMDDVSWAFAPGSDHLAYLAGAENVRALGMETRLVEPTGSRGGPSSPTDPAIYRFTRYAFDLDGLAFAQHLRDQLESYLRQRGELPLGLTLDSSRVYQQTTGEGELWVDERGLPLRLIMHLSYPEEEKYIDIRGGRADRSGHLFRMEGPLKEGLPLKRLIGSTREPMRSPNWDPEGSGEDAMDDHTSEREVVS